MLREVSMRGYAVGFNWKEGKERKVSLDNCESIRFFATEEEAKDFAETMGDAMIAEFEIR